MFHKPLVRCTLRLFTLAIMVGMLCFLVTTEKVAAGTLEECEQAFAFCLYENCPGLTGQAYDDCRAACDLTYESCRWNGDYQPGPAPFIVEDNRWESCMSATENCWLLDEPIDILMCDKEISDYCDEHYPRP